ncbi:MAG: RluA family pseudouridine synthase [Epsilonproteobacteria bacterium]|nr:RluA family pseudouridine synthase [Campylobacterota bacterium]
MFIFSYGEVVMINGAQKTPSFIICDQEQDSGLRLDKFLLGKFPDHSRSYLQDLIKEGCVSVNKRIVSKTGTTIRLNDHVTIEFRYWQPNSEPADVKFEIIDEQPDFIVVNKPAGLLVHQARSSKDEVSLVNGLLARYKEFSDFDDPARPGIVHRLDRETSGLLLVARHRKAQTDLAAMFKDRAMNKTYVTLVHGNPPQEGKIDYPIGRNPMQPQRMSHMGFASKPALTYYRVLEYFQDFALVEAKIVTGRTHQIRVHMTALGHSIVGDGLYGSKSKLIARQALHAQTLEFEYGGKKYHYTCPLPRDFQALLGRMKKI